MVFDNAKCVVLKADWYDPELHPKIIEFCKHYNFALLPTRPATPRHKGKRDVLWLGPPGTGKSHLCQSIGIAAIRSGFTVYYRSIFDTVRDFLHDAAMEGHEKILQRYLKPDLLIVDDMGMKQLPKRSGEHLFEIIMRRHELRSTMMPSNRPLEVWGQLIGDVPSATAILDRFLHRAEVVQITGKSYRLEKSKKTSNDTKAPTGSPAEE